MVARDGRQRTGVWWQNGNHRCRIGQSALRETDDLPFTRGRTYRDGALQTEFIKAMTVRSSGFHHRGCRLEAFGGDSIGGDSACFDSDYISGDSPDRQGCFYPAHNILGGHRPVQQEHVDQLPSRLGISVRAAGGCPERVMRGGE